MMSLPPFLQLLGSPTIDVEYYNAIFQHRHPFGRSHALWWPPKRPLPTTILFFIPGNPGLLGFYIPYLSSLYAKDTTSTLAIFAYSHIGLTPGVDTSETLPIFRHGLLGQVEGAIEAFDALRSAFDSKARIVIVGHSVGAWLSLQVLKARPSVIAGVFLLFPTISHLCDTPNGRKLSWLFTPRVRTFISRLSHMTRILPLAVLSLLFSAWPSTQLLVLQKLLRSPSCVLAALQMADDEMHIIREIDVSLLTAHRAKLWFYYAEKDDWVGEQMPLVLSSFKPILENTRIVHGRHDIPHAFCINHGEHVASQCHQWLNNLDTMPQ